MLAHSWAGAAISGQGKGVWWSDGPASSAGLLDDRVPLVPLRGSTRPKFLHRVVGEGREPDMAAPRLMVGLCAECDHNAWTPARDLRRLPASSCHALAVQAGLGINQACKPISSRGGSGSGGGGCGGRCGSAPGRVVAACGAVERCAIVGDAGDLRV
jgi:hypothetical protein